MERSSNFDNFFTHLKPFTEGFWDIANPYKLFASKYMRYDDMFLSCLMICHANHGADKKCAGSRSYISIHLFLKFSNSSIFICLFFVFWNLNTVLTKKHKISVMWNKTKITIQEVQKHGKLEEASTAYHQEPHIISKLLIRFVLSRI